MVSKEAKEKFEEWMKVNVRPGAMIYSNAKLLEVLEEHRGRHEDGTYAGIDVKDAIEIVKPLVKKVDVPEQPPEE